MSDEPYTGDTSYNLPRAEIAGCALVQDLLPLYIDNEVSPESHALIAAHLEQCERCSGFLAGARSVRAQILDEETKVRAAFAYAPAVAAVQQPVWSSPLATLWRFAMLLVWCVALAITFLGVMEGAPPALVIGGFGTLAAIGGLLIAGGEQRLEWRIGMLLTGLLGAFCVTIAVLSVHYPLAGLEGVVIVGGLMQLTIAAWGLWPRRPRTGAKPAAGRPVALQGTSGSDQPMLTALLSLAGAVLSAGLLLAGIAMVSGAQVTMYSASAGSDMPPYAAAGVETMVLVEPTAVPPGIPYNPEFVPAQPLAPQPPAAPALPPDVVAVQGVPATAGLEAYAAGKVVGSALHWDRLLLGTALIGAGVAGLLLIAGRRGWLPRELRGLSPRRWLGYALVGAGVLWLSMALRALLVGLLPSLPSAGIAAAVLLLGWALARRPPPEEPRVV